MVVWCNTERFNSATLITEHSAKQLMISKFIYENIQKMVKRLSKGNIHYLLNNNCFDYYYLLYFCQRRSVQIFATVEHFLEICRNDGIM